MKLARSARAKGPALVSLAMLLIAAIALIVWLTHHSERPPREYFGLVDREQIRSPGGASLPTLIESSTPKADASSSQQVHQCDLQVVDTISRRPLSGVALRIDSLGVRLTTDESGKVALPADAQDHSDAELKAKLPDSLGGDESTHNLSTLSMPDVQCAFLEIAAFSRLDIALATETGSAFEASFRIVALPPLPSEHVVGTRKYRHLKRVRSSAPETFEIMLEGSGLIEEAPDVVVEGGCSSDDGSSEDVSLLVPHTGEVHLSAFTNGYVPYTRILHLVRGQATSCSISFHEKPTISGVLLDENGAGIPHAEVTVASQSTFGDDELLPKAQNETGSPAFIVSGRHSKDESNCIAQLTVQTDQRGRFEVSMPFTDHISVWAFVEGYQKASVTRDVDGRLTSVKGIRLTLVPSMRTSKMILVSETGEIPAGVTFQPVEEDPPHPFQLQYPKLTSDDRGFVDVSYLDPGKRYRSAFTKGGYEAFVFVCQPGGEIVVSPID